MKEKLAEILTAFERREHELIPVLQRVQEELGYLPREAMLEIARFLRIPEARVFAVATFYAQFRFTPIGRTRVMVCRGTACHVRGAPRILDALKDQFGIDEGETTEDLEYTLETVACIGACGLSPCIMVGKKVEAKLTPQKVADLFGKGGKE
jgi:NADH-quinone oxidoreductase subunit E